MKDWIGILLAASGYALLFYVDWRIATGLFLWAIGRSLENAED